ncbi:Uncharacterised protein [Delftia tsuruhatensis]|nr:Uncharacterised protein [Delftia tsuruhatensis]
MVKPKFMIIKLKFLPMILLMTNSLNYSKNIKIVKLKKINLSLLIIHLKVALQKW